MGQESTTPDVEVDVNGDGDTNVEVTPEAPAEEPTGPDSNEGNEGDATDQSTEADTQE